MVCTGIESALSLGNGAEEAIELVGSGGFCLGLASADFGTGSRAVGDGSVAEGARAAGEVGDEGAPGGRVPAWLAMVCTPRWATCGSVCTSASKRLEFGSLGRTLPRLCTPEPGRVIHLFFVGSHSRQWVFTVLPWPSFTSSHSSYPSGLCATPLLLPSFTASKRFALAIPHVFVVRLR
eukprot:Skav228177  [mRNA]  locus=scaffold3933:162506:179789:- [translate_table: standard]